MHFVQPLMFLTVIVISSGVARPSFFWGFFFGGGGEANAEGARVILGWTN